MFLVACFSCCVNNGCIFKRSSFECKIDITTGYVYFDQCYNGLLINELEIEDSTLTLYPQKYRKVSQYELLSNDSSIYKENKVKVFFNKKTRTFTWRVYQCTEYDFTYCYPEVNNYEIKDTIKLFKPRTWYLFSFYNPQFEVFVYCNDRDEVSFVKKKLSSNF